MSASPIDDARLDWRTSSYTNANNNDCVELATYRATVLVRDTKNRDGAALRLRREGMRSLITAVKSS